MCTVLAAGLVYSSPDLPRNARMDTRTHKARMHAHLRARMREQKYAYAQRPAQRHTDEEMPRTFNLVPSSKKLSAASAPIDEARYDLHRTINLVQA